VDGPLTGSSVAVALVGPTAVGKSSVALRLVERLAADGVAAEIVNADSMQLYRGMDIGTAKPSADDRRRARHHLYDVWDVRQAASVAEYQQLALDAVRRISERPAVPLLVGGSGLYVRAVVDRIAFPGTDPQVRAALEAELARNGAGQLHNRLAAVDPAAAAAILPSNGRRIVRALEVVEITGRPFSANLPDYADSGRWLQIGLDRDDLDERIEARAAAMFAGGLVEEVRRLLDAGLREGPTASRALGYAQAIDFLDGRCGVDDAERATAAATRRFARRQRSWFRRDPRVRWRPGGASQVVDEVAEHVLSHLRRTLQG
jgi:tRNA dimethylallyltransferase